MPWFGVKFLPSLVLLSCVLLNVMAMMDLTNNIEEEQSCTTLCDHCGCKSFFCGEECLCECNQRKGDSEMITCIADMKQNCKELGVEYEILIQGPGGNNRVVRDIFDYQPAKDLENGIRKLFLRHLNTKREIEESDEEPKSKELKEPKEPKESKESKEKEKDIVAAVKYTHENLEKGKQLLIDQHNKDKEGRKNRTEHAKEDMKHKFPIIAHKLGASTTPKPPSKLKDLIERYKAKKAEEDTADPVVGAPKTDDEESEKKPKLKDALSRLKEYLAAKEAKKKEEGEPIVGAPLLARPRLPPLPPRPNKTLVIPTLPPPPPPSFRIPKPITLPPKLLIAVKDDLAKLAAERRPFGSIGLVGSPRNETKSETKPEKKLEKKDKKPLIVTPTHLLET